MFRLSARTEKFEPNKKKPNQKHVSLLIFFWVFFVARFPIFRFLLDGAQRHSLANEEASLGSARGVPFSINPATQQQQQQQKQQQQQQQQQQETDRGPCPVECLGAFFFSR